MVAGLDRETADNLLTTLQSFERILRWGFRVSRRPDDPGPTTQATLFLTLRMQPVRAKDLSEAMGIGPGPLSRQLADLEAQGLISREPDPQDARAARIRLTQAGRQSVLELREHRVGVLQRALAGMPVDQVRLTIRMMDTALEEFGRGLADMGPPTTALPTVAHSADSAHPTDSTEDQAKYTDD